MSHEIQLRTVYSSSRYSTDDVSHITAPLCRYAVRAEALFLQGEFDDAMRLVRQGLKLNPDDNYAKKVFKKLRSFQRGMAEAKTAGEARIFDVVIARYTELIDHGVADKVTTRCW